MSYYEDNFDEFVTGKEYEQGKKKKLTKNQLRVKKHAKEIRKELKNSKIIVSAKQISNL